ncbi:MAG: hypothetical protein AB7O26_00480 [Planctomycetaceae bacterium]
MKSPFAIFRKHQKIMMVVLVGLAMFAFIVMDSIQMTDRSGRSGGAFMAIAALAGAALFWSMGRQSGNGAVYGVVGAVVGLAAAAFVPSMFAPPAPYQTVMGDIDDKKLQELAKRREIANGFLRLAFEKTMPEQNNPFLAQFYMQRMQASMFGFGRPFEEDLVLGFLLSQEADEMGIQLGDEAVTKYIIQATDRKLAPSDFAEIRKSIGVSETDLYNAFREELRIRLAHIHSVPREVVTPEQYWEEYEKLSIRKELEIAAVPVKDFVGEIADPAAAEVGDYFTKFSGLFPDDPNKPLSVDAFGQPRRVRVGYLQSEYDEQLESEVAAVTDADVEKYYNDNKERYRNHRPLDAPLTPPGSGSAAPAVPLTPPEPPAQPEPPAANPPAEKSEGEKKSETPAAPETQPEAEKKGDPGQASNSPSDRGLIAQGPASAALEGNVLLAALQEEKKGEEPAKEAPKEEPAKEDAPAAKSEEKSEPKPDAPSVPEAPAAPAAPAAPEAKKPVAAERPRPEFRPLDNDLKEEIREQILQERARAEQKSRIEAAYQFMASLEQRYSSALNDLPGELTVEQRVAEYTKRVNEKLPELKQELEKYATEHKLKYVETKPLSARELYEAEEEYPIGRATEPVDNEFARNEPTSTIETLFRAMPDQLLAPAIATDASSNWYVFWKIEDIAQHVPKLDDPGVREQVIAAWKLNSARPKAEERAKALAELIRKAEGGTTEALKGQTVNGKPDGPAVSVIPTTPVSWLRVSTVPSTGMMPNRQPELSEIPGVEKPDNDFMKTVFESMKVGDVNVLPNADRTVYYVVKVKSRTPAEPSDIAAHRQAFLREDLFSGGGMFGGATTYDYLLSPSQQQARAAWFQQLEAKYALRRNPRGGTEEGAPDGSQRS